MNMHILSGLFFEYTPNRVLPWVAPADMFALLFKISLNKNNARIKIVSADLYGFTIGGFFL